ncbi:uncharacterized protein LOC127257940 isoform X2 [Andrographis paniculata]|uniref:uncharacterized protein LOC127257940 isoform X2 n=1 Tax=Andrographis paniculata TaxID=175694 RepID=UPI0021E87A3B|nr:uncharacterized protein LOC127257940 isoform X2 [Andrographis paniculata]
MCPKPQLTRLCNLLGESIRSFRNSVADSHTDEDKDAVLIPLSKVFRQVKQWVDECDSESLGAGDCSGATASYLDNRHCLATVIGDLMFVLSIDSQFVRQLAGNTLAAISDGWDDFVHLMCLCLELAIRNCLPSASSPCPAETSFLEFEQFAPTSQLKLKLKNADSFVVATVLQSLRNILKNLKRDYDEKPLTAYLNSVSSLMLNSPWDMFLEIYVGHNMEAHRGSKADVAAQMEITQPRETTVLFGNFIQFLCSLVALEFKSVEDKFGFTPVICKITDLVPKLLAWSHAEFQSPHPARIFHYFRHKVLMIMIKLSSSADIEQATLTTWIHLLHKYCEDLLLQPLCGNKSDPDGSLEGSPFCTSCSDLGKRSMSSRHLQRLAVFLFLKCSLNLMKDTNSSSECVDLTEIHKWIQAHLPADMTAINESYFDRCMRFSLSFFELFMDEDDILFEMLLELLRAPFSHKRPAVEDEQLAGVKTPADPVSDLFHPIHLFHLFLAKIHYDHQVLLDYLISKDTGSRCAEYLLRSLRIVCDSWTVFTEFPELEESSGQSSPKDHKAIAECKDTKRARFHESQTASRNEPHAAARDCLLSLRASISNLHQKNLFLYNPQVLLRRLSKFQELCGNP